ncbi:hypothetical protein GIB67_036693 [Kingdonia uniflora]|uniref:Glutaredoxin domain-containing protein n=1 Tax=Kingdonia uniflora TaxID=39325 RepID=A0A7J7LWN7_9MAGN|nr:hypothetical protein GIB67_036693 [Kingdonia uniflora]
MWPPWATNSPSRPHTKSSNFTFTTFKDIQSLIEEEPTKPHLKKPSNIFHRVRIANSILRSWSTRPPQITLPGTESRIVIYSTSLRVVRKTFEDCRTVQSIFRAFRVSIDERDLSMDSSFQLELQRILGFQTKKRGLGLPRVFIGGRYIGGADEIRQLHETGELKNLVQGFVSADISGGCDECGGYRFVLCEECNGSRKCYVEKGGFRTCLVCNENGLIRCSTCSF